MRGAGLEYLKPAFRKRHFQLAYGLLLLVLFFLAGRSVQLQIVEGQEYRSAAEINRIRIVRTPAPRGAIVDRHGAILTRNVPRFQITLNPLDLPREAEGRETILTKLAKLTQIPLDTLRESARLARLPVSPIVLTANLKLADVYPLLIATQDIPGIAVEIAAAREYLYGEAFAHLLGYLGSIDAREKPDFVARGYRLNDTVGKAGLEKTYEKFLRGRDGRTYVEVDAQGATQTTIAKEEALSGQALALMVDAELQRKVTEIMKTALSAARKTRAAAVALDPSTGGILAMVSLPSYDTNLFSGGATRGEAYRALLANSDHPLFPRAIAGVYPSGSTIKPVLAAAALQEGIITRNTSIVSTGGLRVGQWFFPDWKTGGHGVTNVTKAIAESVNTFFYMIGGGYDKFTGLGMERLPAYLERFGFGKITGIELPGEAKGFVPTPQWKEATKSGAWYIGDTYHLAIGQGDFLVTPLQVAQMTAYFASGGKWVEPRLTIRGVEQQNRSTADSAGPGIAPEHIETVRRGMRAAVTQGSARSLQALSISSAGKTGTAQWSSTKSPHAWFTGFAPYDNPEIVITILVEEGGEGSAMAVPIAREILDWWAQNIHKPT